MLLVFHVILQDHGVQKIKWLYGQQPIKVCYRPAKFGGHNHYGSGVYFSLSRDLTRPHDQVW